MILKNLKNTCLIIISRLDGLEIQGYLGRDL